MSENNEEIKIAVQRLRSVAEGLEIACSQLDEDALAVKPSRAVGSIRAIADDLEKLLDL